MDGCTSMSVLPMHSVASSFTRKLSMSTSYMFGTASFGEASIPHPFEHPEGFIRNVINIWHWGKLAGFSTCFPSTHWNWYRERRADLRCTGRSFSSTRSSNTHTHTPLLMCIEWWLFSTLFCSLFLFLFLDGVCRCSVNCYSFSSGFLDYCVSFPFSSVGYPGSDTGVGVTFPFADNTSVHTSCLTVSITGVYISASCCPFHSYSGPNYWAWACCCQVSRLLVDPTEWPLVV